MAIFRRYTWKNPCILYWKLLTKHTLLIDTWNEYFKDTYYFEVRDVEIFIGNKFLDNVLKSLSKVKLETFSCIPFWSEQPRDYSTLEPFIPDSNLRIYNLFAGTKKIHKEKC